MSSNKNVLYTDTPNVPQLLQFTHLGDRVFNMNITSLLPSLCCLYPRHCKIIAMILRALCRFLDAHPTAASLSTHRKASAFCKIHWSPKVPEQTCLAESYFMTEKSLNLTKSETKEKKRGFFVCLLIDSLLVQ